jgi:hypothetical protein
VQVALWDRNEIGEGTVVVQDSEHRPVGAVGRSAGTTSCAGSAAAVYFTNHTPPGKWARLRNTDELVTEHATESHVAPYQLQIGFANSGAEDLDDHFVTDRGGVRSISSQFHPVASQFQRTHAVCLPGGH